jgi:hypothetical protein
MGAIDPFAGTEALEQQQLLLGLMGQDAQAEAIANIPLSPAQQVAQERERRQLVRSQGFGRGGGAQLLAQARLGGAQQSQNIFNRLNQLGMVSDVNRAALAQQSGLTENALAREAALTQGIGQQQAAVLLGQVAPVTSARTGQVQAQSLANLSQQQRNQALLGQVPNLIPQQGAPVPVTDPQSLSFQDKRLGL